MEIRVSQAQGSRPVTIFHLAGDLNVVSHEQLEQLARAEHAKGTRDLVLDLSQVGYVSSAGVRAISRVFRLLQGDSPAESDAAVRQGMRDGTFRSPHLKLVNPSPAVNDVLSLTGMDRFLEVHRSLDAAVASF